MESNVRLPWIYAYKQQNKERTVLSRSSGQQEKEETVQNEPEKMGQGKPKYKI